MPTRERLRTIGLRQADAITVHVGREARELRVRAGLSQARLSDAVGVSRQWLAEFEGGHLSAVDVRRLAVLFACLGHKLVVKAYPTGEPLRDAGQLHLLDRFNARLSPAWQRTFESVMPLPGDLRAWDELLALGGVRIGVDAETRPNDLQAIERAMAGKQRDSGVDRMILLVSASKGNRALVRANVAALRQTFPLDTRATLDALASGRDPGANGLVLL